MTPRSPLRLALALLGGFLAGGRLVAAVQAWQAWHGLVADDPSLEDFYRTEFGLQVAATCLTLGGTYIVWRLLRPR